MNALDYAINEVKHKIPYEILHAGMTYGEDPHICNMSSIEDKVVQKVIRKRVLLMCNVIGGIQTMIPINQLHPSVQEQMYTIYQIPPELTMNKEVVSALSLSYLPGAGFMGGTGGYTGIGNMYSPIAPHLNNTNPIVNVADRIGSAASTSGVLTNAHLEIVARNTVAVYANYRALMNFGMLVVLENDNNLNNIQPRSYQALGRLCELATKAYIYNKLLIPLNAGYLASGQDLGVFRSTIESYQSAEEDYQTYITEVWGKIMFMNDTTRHNRFISSMIAPDL